MVHALLEKAADGLAAHARAQADAGCDAIQIFDTNAGNLMVPELEEFAFHYAARIIESLQDLNKPVIYFARGIGPHFERATTLGAHVLGVDWAVNLADVR